MGLFENLGERVERFKQQAERASRERAPYECADCGKAIHIEREDCPDCGSENVLEREPAAEQEAAGDDGVTNAEGSDATSGESENPTE